MKKYWELFKKNDSKVMSRFWEIMIILFMVVSAVNLFQNNYTEATFNLGLIILAKLNLNDCAVKNKETK